MRRKNFFIGLFLCGASCGVNSAWGACNLQGNGKWWKGLSLAGVQITDKSINWAGSSSGNGLYDVSLSVTMEQGVKNYYSSTDGSSWTREDLPEGVLDYYQDNCFEGNVVTAMLNNTSVGGGTISFTISGGAAQINANTVQLLNNSSNLPTIAQIATPPGAYMVGISQSVYSGTWNGRISYSARGVSEGNYTVNVPVDISGVSVWFQGGSNYWDRIDGQQVAPFIDRLWLSIPIRIGSDGKPADPSVSCNVNTSLIIDHEKLRKDVANGNTKIVPFQIQCNSDVSASVKLVGEQSYTDYVKVTLGRGISSALSVSTDQSRWYNQMNQNLIDGITTIYFKSVLQVENDSDVGVFDGAAIAQVIIN
ncbi:hypothetical protein [Escherichia coli]|uniref:hypothetical protein n=1 Tax=Escherichia coli TaxID=562 RepID=UPI00215740DF|nr:hypothetical protein [Escherichia coli]